MTQETMPIDAEIVEPVEKVATVDEISKTLTTTTEREITPTERLELLQRTIFKGFTPSEIALTVQRAKAMWVDILAGELWVYKDTKWNLLNVVSHKYLTDRLFKNERVSSMQSGVVYEWDEYEMNKATGEVKHISKHAFKKDRKAIGAWCIVWQTDGKPYCIEAWSEYDKWVFTWSSHKTAMFQKTAEGIACKRFVNSGISYLAEWEYAPEEAKLRSMTKPDLSQLK